MSWPSASAIAHIDQFILENAFQCDARLVPIETAPAIVGMTEKGQPDIAPEFWTSAAKAQIERGVAEGRLLVARRMFTGEHGLWVPAYMVDKNPSLATLRGVIENAALFKKRPSDTTAPFYGGPSGKWVIALTVAKMYRTFGLDKAGFQLIDPGSGVALYASLARAYQRRQPWFGYYYTPSALLGKYDMVKVDLGVAFDRDLFERCYLQKDCTNPEPTNFPSTPVLTLVVPSFARRAPEAYAYLRKRSFTTEQINAIVAWMKQQQADGDDAAAYVLSTYPQLWTSWLDDEAVVKVKGALAEL